MEAIQQDLLKIKLQEQKNEYQSLQDICGQQMDGSYSDQMQFMFTNATNMISIGGLSNLTQGQTVNVQFNLDNSIIHLDRSFIVGELTLTTAQIHNYCDLIRPTQFSMGSVSIPFTNGQFLVKQKMMRMSEKKMRKYAKQIGIQYDAYTKMTSVANVNTIYSDYESLFIQQAKWQVSDTNAAGTAVIKFAIPLHFIWPNLQGLDEKSLWTGVGQTLQLQGQLNQNADVLIADGGAPSYRLDNCGLLYCYSKVPQTVGDLVLKSRVSIPKVRHVWYGGSLSNFGTTINAQFNISKKERIRYLYFAFHPLTASSNTATATTAAENIYTRRAGVYSRLHYPLMCANIPLQQIQVDINGRVFTVQQSALQLLHLVDDSDKYRLQVHPSELPFSQVFCLDLRRFVNDSFGSSAQEQGIVRVAITIQTGLKSIYGQGANWSTDAIADGGVSINEYQFHSFLECFSDCHLENGVYV